MSKAPAVRRRIRLAGEVHEAGGDATIERVFTLDAAPQALVQSRAGRVRGKLVVAID